MVVQEFPRGSVKRKACRREVKRTLKRIGWAPPRENGLRADDVTKAWLGARCAACRRCPKFSAKVAALKLTPG